MRWLLRVFFGLVVIVLLAVAGLLLLPSDRIAGYAEQKFQETTGRTLTLKGGVKATFYPNLGVRLGAVEIANADWSKKGPMVKADGVVIGVELLPLLQGDVRIRKIVLQSPVILLERAADGRTNWEFSKAGASGPVTDSASQSPESASGIPAFTLEKGIIRKGKLTYIDHATGSTQQLTNIDATLQLPDFAKRADLMMSARLHGQPFKANGNVAEFGGFLGGGVTGVNVVFSAGGSKVDFAGRAGLQPMAAEGKLNADLADMPALFAMLGQSAPDLPAGLGRKVRIIGKVIYTGKGSAHLRDAKFTMEQNQLTGNADLFFEKRPRLNAQFTTPMLDLSGLSAGGDASGGNMANGGASNPAPATGWSTEPIDVSGLSALDAEVSFIADGMKVAGANLGKSRVLMVLKRARAVFDLRELRAYDGLVTGQFVVNGRGGLSVGGNMRIGSVQMQPLLRDMAGYERLIGTGDMEIKFLGVGNSMAAITRSLSGNGALKLGQGEILGLDLVGMLRNLDTSYRGKGKKTIFDSIGATFTIKKGVLSNDDLLFKAPLATATGKGTVDIGAKTIDYRVTPVALAKADGSGGISVPVIIKGPWSKLKFRPDLKSLVKGDLGIKAEDAKRRAQEAINGALADQLGVTRQDGESTKDAVRRELGVTPDENISTEDAVKRKLEEEAAKGLIDLLGGNK